MVYFFKPGFVGVTPVSASVSDQPIIGQMLCSNTLGQKTSNIYQWGCVWAGECIQSVLFYFPLSPLTPPLREQTGSQEGMCKEFIKVLCDCLISRVFLFNPH